MDTPLRILRKLRWSLTQRGLAGTIRASVARLGRRATPETIHPFDVEHGVETSGLIGGADLATGHAHDRYNTAYYGMSPSRFAGAMRLWTSFRRVGPIESYTFIDLGCGKGRAILLASQLPFLEVVGVELNPELARVAARNLAIWIEAEKGVPPVQILVGDATEFEFPGGPCLLYLFNPFAGPVLDRLLDRIEASFRGREEQMDLIYFNPESAELIDRRAGFALLWSGTIEMSAEDTAVDLVANPDDLCNVYRYVGSK